MASSTASSLGYCHSILTFVLDDPFVYLFCLTIQFTLGFFKYLYTDAVTRRCILNSLALGAVVTALSAALALPLALLAVRYRFPGKSVLTGLLPVRVPLLVMETSRELPSFSQGKGPVIRVGDRMSVYDDRLTRWMSDRAEKMAKEDPGFRYQRALMPGGMCEASLFQLTGRPTGALALALENYHNMGPRGAAAESVHRRDAEQMLELMEGLALRGPDPRREERLLGDLRRIHRRYAGRFKK